jgi:hypothetical protein
MGSGKAAIVMTSAAMLSMRASVSSSRSSIARLMPDAFASA